MFVKIKTNSHFTVKFVEEATVYFLSIRVGDKASILVPMFDEVAIFVSRTHLGSYITNQLYNKAVTPSAAHNGLKRVRNRPKSCPKIKVGRYGELLYRWVEHQKRDKKLIETYA